jgi:hypothetical protein
MQVSVKMSEVMNNMMKGVVRSVCIQVVEACGLKYGFNVEEAMRDLCIEVSVSGKKDVVVKPKKMVSAFPLPFNGEQNEMFCQALRQNNGLYTQCQASKKEGNFCKSCQQLANKSEAGMPEYGTISQRLACDPFNYTDPKGRKPTAYTKVMKKYKLTEEQVVEEASKFGITINPAHFVAPEETKRGRPAAEPKEAKEPKGSKGRPKKTTKVVQIDDDDEDLFASLVASAQSNEEDDKEAKLTAEKAAKAEKLAAEKQEKEAKLAAEKAAKAEKLAAEKQEKEAKLAAEKEAKLVKAEQLKAEKEAKLAKAEQEKQEKAAKLAAEKAAKEAAKEAAKTKKIASPPPPKEEEEQEETYKKCGEVNGVKYIRSQQTGIVYDFDKYTESEELYAVGKWNADKKEIVFDKAGHDDELSEDEVDDE